MTLDQLFQLMKEYHQLMLDKLDAYTETQKEADLTE